MKYDIARLLREEAKKRDTLDELSFDRPDPLIVAKRYNDEYIGLICALFAYGNAKLIVKFLSSLDFSLLDNNKEIFSNDYYRFQSKQDVIEFFKTMRLLKSTTSIEKKFYEGYAKNSNVMDGLSSIISYMYDLNSYRSRGYEFLIGKVPTSKINSPYKRWHMYLRWMVRYDNLDMGLWSSVNKKDLLVPLDTHTFKVGKQFGLIKRKSYDFKLDLNDPVKFDFALYRIGQENLNSN